MRRKPGYFTIILFALFLTAGLCYYEVSTAPQEVPLEIGYLEEVSPNPVDKNLKVHINTASLDKLQQLPRIGKETAKKIRAYITAHGKIILYEQLLEIDGIGEQTLKEIKPYIVLD